MKFLNSLKKKITRKNKNSLQVRGAIFIFATVISNFFNFVFNAYLGREIRIEDFAIISLIGSILTLWDIPVSALGKTVTYRSAFFLGKYKKPAYRFWAGLRKRSFLISLVFALFWTLCSSFIAKFFLLESVLPVFSFTPLLLFAVFLSIDGGYLRGNLKFGYLAAIGITEAIAKLLIAIVFIEAGFSEIVYLSIPLSMGIAFLLMALAARKIRGQKSEKVSAEEQTNFPYRFYFSNAVTRVSSAAYLTLDIILAKHFLPPVEAGQYALLSLVGKMVFFAGSLFGQFITPMVSHHEGAGRNSDRVFNLLLLATAVACLAAVVPLGVFGHYLMPLAFGNKINAILPYIGWYALGMAAFTIATNIVSFHQIKNRHLLPIISFILACAQVVAIGIYHGSVADISNVMVVLGFTSLAISLLVHFFHGPAESFLLNFVDFLDIFKFTQSGAAKNGYKILIYNWRDTKHVWAGGAEVYVHELAKRLVQNGNSVTVFCGNDRKSSRNQIIDGVQIVRRGGFYTVYFWAFVYYLAKFRGKFDVVIDSENGIPFFTPLFSFKPVILLIHHVHQEVFVSHLKFPFSLIGRVIEGKMMPYVYRECQVVTVSESSKREILRFNLAKETQIEIVHPGVEIEKFAQTEKTQNPSFIYLGRIKAYKNIHIAIKAFARVARKYPTAQFSIVGEGEEQDKLKDLVGELKLGEKVSFLGKVSEKKKAKLLASHWVAIQPSMVEGWGITVIEANACGTPVVASRVNGLTDSVDNRKTGILVTLGSVKEFSDAMQELIENKKLRLALSESAIQWSKKFSWDQGVKRVSLLIDGLAKSKKRAVNVSVIKTLLGVNNE